MRDWLDADTILIRNSGQNEKGKLLKLKGEHGAEGGI